MTKMGSAIGRVTDILTAATVNADLGSEKADGAITGSMQKNVTVIAHRLKAVCHANQVFAVGKELLIQRRLRRSNRQRQAAETQWSECIKQLRQIRVMR